MIRHKAPPLPIPALALALFFPVLLLAVTTAPAHAQSRPAFLEEGVTYLWPTNASRYMSSSFGETRAAHFHAAMDIGTWGHEGHPVYATRDGVLHRVAVGPVGYGNVIYLRHDDNTISLYAHLKDFHPEIRAVVDSLRMKQYQFKFDRNMEEFGIAFRRGQHIGWTGSTGVGPPHLHFELRTPGGKPFNPLLAGIRIEDTIPPQFSELAIEPLSPGSSINGQTHIHRKTPVRRDGIYHFGTVTVEGEVGLAADVFDRANASNNVHAVYELEMRVNGERLFHSRADSFSYGQARQMFIDRVFPILHTERKGLQRLYIHRGNTLPFYSEIAGHDGRLRLPAGTHNVRIAASDYFGNRSTARLILHVEEPTETLTEHITARVPFDTPSGIPVPPLMAPEAVYWHKNWMMPPESSSPDDTLSQWRIRPVGSFEAERDGFTSGRYGLPLDVSERMELSGGGAAWTMHRIMPGYPVSVLHDAMRLKVTFPSRAFFAPVTVGLAGTHTAFSLYPASEPLNQPATVRILLDRKQAATTGIGLYRTHPRTGKPVHISSFIDIRNHALVGELNAPGDYYLAADSLAPEISDPKIGRWRHTGKAFVTVTVTDELSGIDHRSAEFYVNGERGIAEYDPEKDLLRYHHPDFTPREENDITVRIRDRAGNLAEKTFSGVAGQ
ncbi:M23 family metallopeptidase [Balneolales bacterium ANBcel1]|nr:M23 family metallopeptidase [Balneolales bacterium ANBcel1]